MPLVKVQISETLAEDRQTALLSAVSKLLAEVTGKPEPYVMAVLERGSFLMAGVPARAAFVDVRGIGGLNATVNARFTRELCALLQRELKIEPQNVYVTFTDVPATHWGWNAKTFG